MTIKVSINYQSWLYPLEGEDAKYFIPLPNRNVLMKTWGCKGIIGILGKVYRVVIDRNYNIIKERNSMMETPKVLKVNISFALYYGKMNP